MNFNRNNNMSYHENSPLNKSCCCIPPSPEPEPDSKPPCVICPPVSKEYAYYSQNNRLYNSALFGGIRFENDPLQTSSIEYDTGVIQIAKSGVYTITYFVNFPENTQVNTTLALQINYRNVTGTERLIIKSDSSCPYTAAAQIILPLEAYSAIRLSSSRVIDIATGADNTAASLSIIEL